MLDRVTISLMAIFFLLLANIDAALQVHYAVQVGALLFGVVLLMGGVSHIRQRRAIPPALVLILLVAFAVRWVDLAEAIPRHIDEIHGIAGIIELWESPNTPVLLPYEGVPAFTRVFTVMQDASVHMLGANLAGLRYVSVLVGVLTVAAVYALGVRLFTVRAALYGAAMLAVFPPHVHFSRLGLNNVVDPFFGVMALAMLIYTHPTIRPKRADALIHRYTILRSSEITGGILLGMTAYFYEGGRLLFPVLILIVLGVQRRRGWWRVLIGYAVIAAPVYVMLLVNGLPFAPRLNVTTDQTLNPLENLLHVLRFLFLEPETSWFYAGNTPLILHWLLPFLLIGGWLAWKRGAWILLVWIGLTIGGNVLLREVQSPRYVVMFPALALLMGLGVDAFVRWITSQQGRKLLLQGVIVLLILGRQVSYYFGEHVPRYLEQFSEPLILDDIRFRSADLPDNTHIQVISNFNVFDSDFYFYLRFVGRHDDGVFTEVYRPADARAQYLMDTRNFRNLGLFIPPHDPITMNMILRTFPDAEPQFSRVPGGYLLFVIPRAR